MENWKTFRLGAILTLAVTLGGLVRDPARVHLISRKLYVEVLHGLVLATAAAATIAGSRELHQRHEDRVATLLAGCILLLYAPVLIHASTVHGVVAWGCGTGRHNSMMRLGSEMLTWLEVSVVGIAFAFWKDTDRRRAWQCVYMVCFLFGMLAVGGRLLAHDRTEISNDQSCYANQENLATAIQKFELDHKTRVHGLSKSVLEVLQKEGYIQPIPIDTHGSAMAAVDSFMIANP